jgi:hypothetical protein
MSLSPVFESDGELAADDGDLDEPFGDQSDECSAGSGGGADQGFGGGDLDGAWPSSGVSVGEGISAARPYCSGVEPTAYGRALLGGGTAVFDDLRQALKDIEFLANPTAGEGRTDAATQR